jgi:hypothetical protein
MSGAPDLSSQYNTVLSPAEEKKFQAWAKASGRERDTYDYDLRGAWKSDAKAAGNGHLPDTWKKPNHPTFSVESQYSDDKTRGGEWVDLGGDKWAYKPSEQNLRNLGPDGLRKYFKEREPDVQLQLPADAALYPMEYKK